MTDVSRETAALLQRYQQIPELVRYVEMLSTGGVQRGLVGPREVPRMWTRHVANCAVVAERERTLIAPGSRVADVGSGAGLPGLVWALVRPDLSVSLIEPLLRRATFLTEVVEELGVSGRVEVLRARAEDLAAAATTRPGFQVVTARAVARLSQLLTWTVPLTEVGGWVVAFKGASAAAEIDEASGVLASLGCGPPRLRTYGEAVLDPPTTVVLVRRETAMPPTRSQRPRRVPPANSTA